MAGWRCSTVLVVNYWCYSPSQECYIGLGNIEKITIVWYYARQLNTVLKETELQVNKWKIVFIWFEEDNLKFYDYVPSSSMGKPTVNRFSTS